jgi:high-affinity iron transporter
MYGEPYMAFASYVRFAIHERPGVFSRRSGALLPAFVIGLREGLEAALIVVIIATFLAKAGRQDTLRAMWTGVGVAALFCLAFGVALQVLDENLPQQQQERLETVIALGAAIAVTYMIVWMRRHARDLRGDLESAVSGALARGSGRALVGMAFFAVIREGLETAVFLVAAFQQSARPALTGSGAILGILVAVALGLGIYRGGVHINLARFFRVTGVVLVIVAAGLLVSAMRSGHEGGWVNVLQGEAVDLSWLVAPGSIRASLLTGMLGLRSTLTVGEAFIWVAYVVPMCLYVLWPARRRRRTRSAVLEGSVA